MVYYRDKIKTSIFLTILTLLSGSAFLGQAQRTAAQSPPQCAIQLFFTDTVSKNQFEDVRTVALNASIELEAKMEKCDGPDNQKVWWRVTMLQNNVYVKNIVAVHSIQRPNPDAKKVPLKFTQEGTYDFYLDYSLKGGTDAEFKANSGASLKRSIKVTKDGKPPTNSVASEDLNKKILPNDGVNIPNAIQGSFATVLDRIFRVVLSLIASFAILFIIIGGFRLAFSQGNTEAVAAGRKTITWAVIGLILAMLSFVIVTVVEQILY